MSGKTLGLAFFSTALSMTLLTPGAARAAVPLPDLRIEPAAGGSIFTVRNTGAQALTAFWIELVDYPGSSYVYVEDESGAPLLLPGAEKKIPVTNMTVGAVPDYVKLRAAIYADGSTAGAEEPIAQLVARRRFQLAFVRRTIARLETAASVEKAREDLRTWEPVTVPPKAGANSEASIDRQVAHGLIRLTMQRLEQGSVSATVEFLRTREKALVESKPGL